MKHVQTLMLVASLCLVTACDGYSPSVSDIDLDPPDAALTEPCPPLTKDPGRALTQAEVTIFWSRDRAAAALCRQKHEGLVQWSGSVTAAMENSRRPFRLDVVNNF